MGSIETGVLECSISELEHYEIFPSLDYVIGRDQRVNPLIPESPEDLPGQLLDELRKDGYTSATPIELKMCTPFTEKVVALQYVHEDKAVSDRIFTPRVCVQSFHQITRLDSANAYDQYVGQDLSEKIMGYCITLADANKRILAFDLADQ